MEDNIFHNKYQDKRDFLDRKGYVILPFLSHQMLSQIADIYNELPIDRGQAFFSTSFIEDNELKVALNDRIMKVINPIIEEYFENFKFLGCSFLTKQASQESEMPIHQDWTVVDEAKYGSYSIWIPLQDTNKMNGMIQAIPGSHKFSDVLRSPSIEIAYQNIYTEMKPYLRNFPMKAGEAFLFNHALMHASPANNTDQVRIAITIGLAPKEAQLYMYYKLGEDEVEKYEMPDDMFVKYSDIRNTPTIGKKINTFKYSIPKLTIEKFRDLNYKRRQKKFDMDSLFLNEDNQRFFEENGYLKLPALDNEDVKVLKDFYSELGMKDEVGYGFMVGMDNPDKDLVNKMMDKICAVALPKVQPFLTEAQIFTASYVVKDQKPQGVVPPHQDWSFVEDEDKHCSVTCWIPLQDVNIENGCIGVIKGSNKFFDSPRPSPSPQVPTPLAKHMYTIFPYLHLVEMKAGEALFFDNRTIHASPPNTSDSTRLAVGLGFTQKEAEICHYYMKPGSNDTLRN